MTRNPIDIALRGLKNALANWQLVAIRMVEGVVFIVIIFLALLVTIIPTAVEAGLGKLDMRDANSTAEAVAQFFVDHHLLILWTLGMLLLVTLALLVIHAFIVAGSVRVYLDAERAGGDFNNVFHGDSFWEASMAGFWCALGIYNIAWGLAGLVILLPFLIGFALVMIASEPAVALVILAVVLVGTILLSIPVGLATSIWVNRALVDGESKGLSARGALAAARAAIRSDLVTHLLLTFFVIIVGIGGTGLVSTVAGIFPAGGITAPMHIIGSLAETAAGALASAWMLASFAVLVAK